MGNSKTTFTAEQLQGAFNDIQTADARYPEFPVKLFHGSYDEIWREEHFPMIIRKIGDDEDVVVSIKEYFDGEEGGDHRMFIIFSVGYGNTQRYFKKTGEYNSWDDSTWDGGIYEVVSQEVKKTEWVTKDETK